MKTFVALCVFALGSCASAHAPTPSSRTRARASDDSLRWPTRVDSDITQVVGLSAPCGEAADGSARCWAVGDRGGMGAGGAALYVRAVNGEPTLKFDAMQALYRAALEEYGSTGSFRWPYATTPFSLPSSLASADFDVDGGCAILEDGAQVKCWGTTPLYSWSTDAPFVYDFSTHDRPVVVRSSQETRRFAGCHFSSCPGNHACALMESGTVQCWGAGIAGQLGDGTRRNVRNEPNYVAGLHSVVDLSLGTHHACALIEDGSVQCWGYNAEGQVGVRSRDTVETTPVPVPGVQDAVAIHTGDYHSCARLRDGSARCWGNNYALGLPDTTNRPRSLTLERPIVQLALGASYTCALDNRGDVWCGGYS